jgi:hypothetical protein
MFGFRRPADMALACRPVKTLELDRVTTRVHRAARRPRGSVAGRGAGRVGLLTGAFGPDSQARVAVFLQAMALLGWTEGQNVQFEIRQGGGNFDTIRKHAGELARLNKRFFYALFSVIRLLGAGRPMSRSVYVFFPLLTIVGALCGPAFGQRAYSNVSTGIFGENSGCESPRIDGLGLQ